MSAPNKKEENSAKRINCLSFVTHHWKFILVIFLPLIWLPTPFLLSGTEGICAYVTGIIYTIWIFNLLPGIVCGILPIIMIPLFKLGSTATVCHSYFSDILTLRLAGITLSLCLEKSGLHQRLVLRTLKIFNPNPRWYMLGILGTTTFLSGICNPTSAVGMMVPVLEKILEGVYPLLWRTGSQPSRKSSQFEYFIMSRMTGPRSHPSLSSTPSPSPSKGPFSDLPKLSMDVEIVTLPEDSLTTTEQISKSSHEESFVTSVGSAYEDERLINVLMMCIFYGLPFGSTMALYVSNPPLVMYEYVTRLYDVYHLMGLLPWLLFTIPVGLLNVFSSWVILQIFFFGCRHTLKWKQIIEGEAVKRLRERILTLNEELGTIKPIEVTVIILYVIEYIVWLTLHSFGYFKGWNELLGQTVTVDAATPAVMFVLIVFMLPSTPDYWFKKPENSDYDDYPATLATWREIRDRVTWGVMLQMGGGIAIMHVAVTSGLYHYLLLSMRNFILEVPTFVLCIFVMVTTNLMTTFNSNTATVIILIPFFMCLAASRMINPLFLVIPTLFMSIHTFLLPISTASNAVIFERTTIKTREMVLVGLIHTAFSVVILLALFFSIGKLLFDFDTVPEFYFYHSTPYSSHDQSSQ